MISLRSSTYPVTIVPAGVDSILLPNDILLPNEGASRRETDVNIVRRMFSNALDSERELGFLTLELGPNPWGLLLVC